MKKIINKIKERLKKSLNTLEMAKGRLALGETTHNRLRGSRTPPVRNMNMLARLGQFSNPQFMELNRLFSDAVQSIFEINKILKIENKFNFNSTNNATNLEKIQEFYNSIIKVHFPQIVSLSEKLSKIPNFIRTAVEEYCNNKKFTFERYGPIELWDVSRINRMEDLFKEKHEFNADIGAWDVSNTYAMNEMFEGATSFNQDIGGWDVSSASYMESMFKNAISFDKDLSGWDVSKVMNNMFDNCPIREKFKCKKKD